MAVTGSGSSSGGSSNKSSFLTVPGCQDIPEPHPCWNKDESLQEGRSAPCIWMLEVFLEQFCFVNQLPFSLAHPCFMHIPGELILPPCGRSLECLPISMHSHVTCCFTCFVSVCVPPAIEVRIVHWLSGNCSSEEPMTPAGRDASKTGEDSFSKRYLFDRVCTFFVYMIY